MSKITHYARIKKNQGVNYYIDNYHVTDKGFTGVDGETAAYLRGMKDKFEIITKNQYEKQHGEKDE